MVAIFISLSLSGDELQLRHWCIYDDWNVHYRISRDFVEQQEGDLAREQEEMTHRFYEGWCDELRPLLDPVKEAIQLDFFGVDGNLTPDGKLVVFEANASMNMFPPDQHDRVRSEFRQQERDRLAAALTEMVTAKTRTGQAS